MTTTKQSWLKRSLAVLLAVMMVMSMGVANAFAATLTPETPIEKIDVPAEDGVYYADIDLIQAANIQQVSMGNAALPFSVSFFMSIINIVLNAVFIFGLHWGVFGAGFATFLARAVSSAAIFLFLYHHKGAVRIQSFFGSGWHGFMVKNILKLAVPTGLEDSIFHIGKLLVQGIVTSYGTAAIAANAVALTISEFTHMPGFAIGLALITVVGLSLIHI